MKRNFIAFLLSLLIFLPACSSHHGRADAPSLPEHNSATSVEQREEVAEASPAVAQADAPDAPAGKTTLTLGGIGLRNSALASLVHNFNAENTKYTVVIDDYAENTQSREQAEAVMRTKLLARDAADLYYFRSDLLSPLPWIDAGLLYDLEPLIAADSEIRKENLIGWTALHEYGGLYLLSPTFGVVGLSCSQQTQRLHTGWTIAEYLETEQSLRPEQEMIYYMDPENFLERIGGRYLRGVIDYEHAQCNLDTPEFREILQSALKAGSYDGGYSPDKNVPQRIVDGELICCYVGLSSALEVSFDRYRCGQTLGYVGWPTPDGSCGFDVRLMMPLGLNAATACPEGCWEFLKYLLLRRLRLLPLPKSACSRSFSALGIPAPLPHVGATSGLRASGGYTLGCAAKVAQTADTGVTGWDWRFGCAFNLCFQ